MASSGKPKTTWSKLQREAKLRERRLDKAARKAARQDAQYDAVTNDQLADESADPEPAAAELEGYPAPGV